MIIRDIRVTHLQAPWVEPPRWSPDYDRPRNILVVEVETASGVIGMGYLLLLAGGAETIKACLKELVIPQVLGRDARDVEAIWSDLWAANYWVGRMGVTVMAQSALDVALWDCIGQFEDKPLHRIWGHRNSELTAYGSGCWRGLGGDGMIEKARFYVGQGFGAIKMQAGHLYDDDTDIAHVRAMRDALGDKTEIMIDVNMGWTADQAIRVGRAFDEYGLYWLEEPVPVEDVDGYHRIAEAIETPVVGGENHFTVSDLRPLLEHPKIPILQPDVMRGGLTELRRIAEVAEEKGKVIAPHLFPELMVQLLASIPNASYIEYVNWMDDAWIDPVLPENGTYQVPERPGHGLKFKPEFVREYRV